MTVAATTAGPTLVRVPLALAAAFAYHVAMSPSTALVPSTSDPDGSDRRTVRGTARLVAALLTKGFFWASALTDALVLLAPHVPPTLSTHALPSISIAAASSALARIRHIALPRPGDLRFYLALPFFPSLPLATAALGTTLALAGALLRRAARDALGQFYACPNLGPGPCVSPHASRRPGHVHALITTGPYASVRHPGCAGLLLCTTSLVVLQLDMVEACLGSRWGDLGASARMRAVALLCAVVSSMGAVWRIQGEERALRARFKGEWEEWAGKVRYKLVPGVY